MDRRRMVGIVVPLALLLLLAPSLSAPPAAGEPSFDCRTANTARELATCADTRIAAADRELAAAWQNAIAHVDPATVKALRADQKKFLEDLDSGFEGEVWGKQSPPEGKELRAQIAHDAVHGCDSFGMSAVHHWPDVDRHVPAKATIEPSVVFPTCALTPRPIVDLPHPFSHVVSKLGLATEQQKSYFDAWLEIRDHGIPRDCVSYAGFSKLLGWPDLLQDDLWLFQSQDDARLLLQVDSYCNGEELHSWPPGGSLYYLLLERDLRAGRFESCKFEGQFT